MNFENRVLVRDRYQSWVLRGGLLLIVLLSAVVVIFASMQYLYQQQVERYFSAINEAESSVDEGSLIISTADHWITASGIKKDIYKPLLDEKLGAYLSHRYIGWHSNYKDWLNSQNGRAFFLMYEVQYEKGSSEESFLFNGFDASRILAREVMVN
ncbi:hypothetical protein [uncultured Endozoicomonas sp.]|uniref:hypothetical protein n=1 Tax=uncultured Endozoicomonas sp. TaxID=432652 RepID=UPI00260C3A70|nr:hypothetical protein [uncultured Endozoicomonas sp.]